MASPSSGVADEPAAPRAAALPIDDRVGLDAAARARLERLLADHSTLQDVVRWAIARGDAAPAVVTQDEYTHDVIVPWESGRYLVYDAT